MNKLDVDMTKHLETSEPKIYPYGKLEMYVLYTKILIPIHFLLLCSTAWEHQHVFLGIDSSWSF